MALIRCPHCDTVHDLDDTFLASGSRKLRCASCRTVFAPQIDESDVAVTIAMPLPQSKAPDGPRLAKATPEAEPDPIENDMDAWGAAEAMPPAPQAEPAAPAAMEADPFAAADEPALASAPDQDISADDLEALFADAAPAAKEAAPEEPAAAPDPFDKPFDPDSLARAQDEAAAAALAVQAQDAGERRAVRGGKGKLFAGAAPKSRAKVAARGGVIAAMVMAAGIGTLASLVMLRDEAMRLFPATARLFDAVGMSGAARGLDIVEVQSQMVSEDGHETLEINGRIVNNGRQPIKLPVLRLAIRGANGSELYVWTATADVTELGPGEGTRFSRRLASPPAQAHSVLVRFVAKDDIVAAIR